MVQCGAVRIYPPSGITRTAPNGHGFMVRQIWKQKVAEIKTSKEDFLGIFTSFYFQQLFVIKSVRPPNTAPSLVNGSWAVGLYHGSKKQFDAVSVKLWADNFLLPSGYWTEVFQACHTFHFAALCFLTPSLTKMGKESQTMSEMQQITANQSAWTNLTWFRQLHISDLRLICMYK